MTGYTTVFGNQPIYSAQPSLLELALTANVSLSWPLETTEGPNVLATIIDVTPDAGSRVITLPDSTQGTPGYAVTFINLGAFTFTVKDSVGGTQLTVASGEAWTIYLRTNTTAAGTWQRFQQGAGTSSANAAGLAGSGLKAISTTLNTKYEVSAKSANYVIVNTDRAVVVQWTGGVGQFTLPDPTSVGTDWYCPIKNAGSGSLTVVPTAGLVDGAANAILATGESAIFYSDGTNFFTIGFGQEVNSAFDFIQINVAGTGDFTLAGVQLNRISYRFTGVLTGNRNIIVPASVQQYWVDNETTGAFTLTVKTAAGTGKVVTQANRTILYCDGTNVVDADSGSFTPPLAVASGGTGATTASNARSNLGSTAVSDAVFIAVSAAAARLALGSSTIGDAIFVAASLAAARAQMGVYYVLKTANETKAATTVLSNDAELFVANLPINSAYEFECMILWSQLGNLVNGIKVAPLVSGVGAALVSWIAMGTVNTSTANQDITGNLSSSSAAMSQVLGAGGAAGQCMIVKGVVTVGANVGRLDIQWAQSVSDAVGTRIFIDSWLRVTKIA